MRTLALTVIAAASLALAGCGSATVDSVDVTTPPPTMTSEITTTTTTQTSAPQPEDRGAREIEEIPVPAREYEQGQQLYLDSLTAEGVNVSGVEDQLIATAQTVCGGDDITSTAVAGQLVEQGRTDMEVEALSEAMKSNAADTVC